MDKYAGLANYQKAPIQTLNTNQAPGSAANCCIVDVQPDARSADPMHRE